MEHQLAGSRILLTGHSGRIGTAVHDHLSALGAKIIGVSQPEFDTTDIAAVEEITRDVDLVVHLAALSGPRAAPWREIFSNNVSSTYNVLSAAAEHGVKRLVTASSINASGIPMNSHAVLPAYYPFDEQLPVDHDDPYSLSKWVDEQTARMVCRHWGADVVALRFPLTLAESVLVTRVPEATANPLKGLTRGWSYLDVRDAALAIELALTRPITGAQPIFVCADETMSPYPTEDLLRQYAPDVPRLKTFVGREVAADLTRARTLLGFRARHLLEIEPLDLPPV